MTYPKSIQFDELTAWLQANEMSQRQFACLIGVDKMTINRLLNGKLSRFDFNLVERVSRGTNGKIGTAAFANFAKRFCECDPSNNKNGQIRLARIPAADRSTS